MKHRKMKMFFLAVLLLGLAFAVPAFSQWEPDRRLTFDDGVQTGYNNSHYVAASGDTVHVVFGAMRNGHHRIFYKRSTDGGTTWGQDTSLSNNLMDSDFPSIAIFGSDVHIVWNDDWVGNYEIYYIRSSDGGNTWGSETRLTYSPEPSYLPCVAVSGKYVHVVWWDHQYGPNAFPIHYKRSKDEGATWDPDTILCIDSKEWADATVAVSDSIVHVVWQDYRRRGGLISDICYQRSTDWGTTWEPDIPLTRDTFNYFSTLPSIAVLDSIVHVTWSDTRDGRETEIYHKSSTDWGITWGSDTRVTWDTAHSFLSSEAVSGSNVHVVWWSDVDTDTLPAKIYYIRSTDRGISWEQETRLTNVGAFAYPAPYIAVAGLKVHVIWMDDRDDPNCEIYYKRNLTGNSGVEEGQTLRLTPYISRLTVSPNPFTSFATVPGHSSESFALYDISGRRVGVYRGDRIGEGLVPGVYFVRAVKGEARPVRIVKVR